MKIYHASNYSAMCQKAANLISAQILVHPQSVLGLATGSTPIGIYERLVDGYSRGDLDFRGITTFNLDEYCGLSEGDPQSYHYYMHQHLFNKVNIDSDKIFLPNGNAEDIGAECQQYDDLIECAGGIDLQLLGMGNNGHIGFNEPGNIFEKNTHCVTLDDDTIRANARFFKDLNDVPRKAVTMGIKTIMQARKILLVVNGKGKQEVLEKALYGPITPMVPASVLQLHHDLTVVYSPE